MMFPIHGATIEYAWFIASLINVVLNVTWLQSVIGQYSILRTVVDVSEGERILARSHLIQEWLRLIKQVLLLIGSIFALYLPPPPPGLLADFQSAGVATACMIISLLGAAMSANSMWAYRRALNSHGYKTTTTTTTTTKEGIGR